MEKNLEKNVYDIIILLCAGGARESEFFTVLDKDKKYLGGPNRMDATIKLYKNSRNQKIIAVGGGITKDKKNKKKPPKINFKKVDKMRKCLLEQGVVEKDIIRISSEHDTLGNFRAIFKVLQCLQNSQDSQKKSLLANFKNKKVGILTNFYHLPRVMRFAIDTFNEALKHSEENSKNGEVKKEINFIPIAAESITKNFSSFNLYPQELLLTVSDEIRGLCDWEKGEYEDQQIKFEEWEGECHENDIENLKNYL